MLKKGLTIWKRLNFACFSDLEKLMAKKQLEIKSFGHICMGKHMNPILQSILSLLINQDPTSAAVLHVLAPQLSMYIIPPLISGTSDITFMQLKVPRMDSAVVEHDHNAEGPAVHSLCSHYENGTY